MAKEMSHDLNDETTEDVASKVLTTKRAATQSANAEQRATDEAPQKSGVGKIDVGGHTKNLPPRPMPSPPRARARVPAPVVPEPQSGEHAEVADSEKTQIYRPNLSEPPVVRPSARPTVRPAIEAARAAAPLSLPKPPKVKVTEAIPGSQPHSTVRNPAIGAHSAEAPEDQTRVCPAAVIEGLLKKEDGATRDALRTAADDVTRVGEIPIEQLVLAERKLANANAEVGHEDVTRSYSFNLNDTPTQLTTPGKRQLRLDTNYEPLVIIQPNRPRRGIRYLVTGLLLLGACSAFFGWKYHATLNRYSHLMQASFMRGISAATGNRSQARRAAPAAAPARVSISVSISVSPAEAVLTIDGTRVPNPFVAQRASDKLSHELTVEAPGYLPLQRRVQFDRDLTVVMALAPIPIAHDVPTEAAKDPETASSSTSVALRAKPTPRGYTQKVPVAKAAEPKTDARPSGCNPPYSIDAKGIKAFKPECL